MAIAAVPVTALLTVGVAWAVFQSSDVVASNDFSTAECFDAQLASVQNGETVHAVNGTVVAPITAVDPTRAFVMASVRSASNEPADSAVQVRLSNGGTEVELYRATDSGAPPVVTASWSVVEYGCGIDVQRGVLNGDGTDTLDVAMSGVDMATSFVLVSSASAADATAFDTDDLFISELTSPTNLRIKAASGSALSAQRTFSWQVVSFADPGDIDVDVVNTTLGAGVTSDSIALGTPADPRTTFLISSIAATTTGPDIGERLVRAHLGDASTLAVSRGAGGDALDVNVQIVTLKDGTTVRHGILDFGAAQPANTVTVEPVDLSRSTAISTVAIPGLTGGGQTDHLADDIVGEASATFALTDAETLSVMRSSSTSPASFAWQVIEWAGPRWWDPNYTFRQRIDIDTGAVEAPDAYTVPVTLDHAALVSSSLSLADGSDVRLLRWDGTIWTELDRVLDDAAVWNDVSTSLWFRTTDPVPADSTHSYWLYFGNDTPAAPLEDPEAVYLLVEDFESGTLGDFEDRTGGTSWYAADPWTRRLPLTIPSAEVPATVTNAPVLVSMTSADLAASAQPDGSDIRFTAADGTTPFAHEVEVWEPGTGTLAAWVAVPSLSSASDTSLFVYYGAADAPDQQQIEAVWQSSGQAASWHLSRNPGGSAPQVDDSSGTNLDGLTTGGMDLTDLVVGTAGYAIDFDGADDQAEVSDLAVDGSAQLTVEAWVRPDAFAGTTSVVAKGVGPSAIIDLQLEPLTASTARLRALLRIDGTAEEATAVTVTTGAWHHLAATYDGANLTAYVDGTPGTPVAATGLVSQDSTAEAAIGSRPDGSANFDGLVDEVRVSHTTRSSAWFDTHIANLTSPTFVQVGAAQSGAWFGQDTWGYRKPVALDADAVDSDLNNFPVLVQVTDAELQGATLASGWDIVFTAADGATRLDHVIEAYDGATGALSAWVAVPVVGSTQDTELFMYYGNPAAADQQDGEAVFGPTADLALLGS